MRLLNLRFGIVHRRREGLKHAEEHNSPAAHAGLGNAACLEVAVENSNKNGNNRGLRGETGLLK